MTVSLDSKQKEKQDDFEEYQFTTAVEDFFDDSMSLDAKEKRMFGYKVLLP